MSDNLLSPLHISKLGHPIEEIRIRALSSVISKYNLQLVDEKNLENTKQLLNKLLDWFDFDIHPEEEKVLKLMLKILQYKNADLILKEIGVIDIKRRIESIETKLNPIYLPLILNIKQTVLNIEKDPDGILGFNKAYDDEIKIISINYNIKPEESTTNSCTDVPNTDNSSQIKEDEDCKIIKEIINKPLFKLEYFPWQSLVASDRHVLSSIYDGLRYIDNKNSILQSCQFFTDVVLKDFPTEIFLQRPLIIQTFFELLGCNQEEIRIPVLNCIIQTVQSLKFRFKFSLDVSVCSFKQEFLNATFPSISRESEDVQSEKSGLPEQFHLNLASSDGEGHFDHDDDEDISFLRKHQSSLPNFCCVVLLQAIPHLSKDKSLEEYNLILKLIRESLSFLTMNLNDSVWKGESETKEKIYQIFGLFQNSLKYHKNKNKVVHSVILTIIVKFLNSLKPPTAAEVGGILPRGIQIELAGVILDFVLIMLYPDLHGEILGYVRQLLGLKEKEIMQDYEETLRVCKSMKSAVKLMKFPNRFKKKIDKLVCAKEAMLSLDFHRNFNFIKDFVKDCLLKWSRRKLKEKEVQLYDEVLIKLLSSSDDKVKCFMYKDVNDVVVKLLGVEEAAHPRFEFPGDKVEFLFNVDVLTEIICHGLSSQIVEVRKCSNEIIIHLLKGKFLMSETSWKNFITSLRPCLSLLQCYAEKSTALGRCIIKMLDPDMATTIDLPLIDIIKGNIRLLFSKDNLTRDEAISRLCWLLTKEDPNNEKLPRMSILQGLNLSAICSSVKPRELSRAKQSFYSVGNLSDVIEMLSGRDVEPSVRRSALSQISVMLEDCDLHASFLEQGGLELVLEILENCLIEKEFHNYPDSVLPIVNILKSLAIYSTMIRQELSGRIEVFYSVLRGLLLFSGEERMRQSAAEFLFLLLYSENVIIVPPERAVKCRISLPQLVISKMCMPFLTHIHWRNSVHLEPSVREALMIKENCAKLLRMYWTVEWFESLADVLALDGNDLRDEVFSPGLPKDMKMTGSDLQSLKNGALSFSVKKRLYDIQNATTHEGVIKSAHKLESYLMLYDLNTPTTETNLMIPDTPLPELPWKTTLERFLTLMPSCQLDEVLLYHVIRLVHNLLKIFKSNHLNEWIGKLLTDRMQSLPNLLKTIGNEDFGMKGREIRKAVIELTQQVVTGKEDDETSGWSMYLSLVTDHLKLNNKEFYNVAYIDWLLGLLVDITGTWTWKYDKNLELHEELIVRVMEIIVAFHCSKDSSRSFMGMNIVKNSLLILNHILSDMQEVKGWEQLWFHALSKVIGHTEQVNYCWLLSLWFVRDPLIRAGAFQLLAGFTTTSRGCQLLMEDLHIEFEHVWNFGFQILLDEDECSLVRDKCAVLLANLTNQGSSVTSADFLQHLININYYREMVNIPTKLLFATTMDEVCRHQKDDTKPSYVMTTPSLLSSASLLLFNVIELNPEFVTDLVIESNLYDSLIRTFQEVYDFSANSPGGMCMEILEMSRNVCRVISKCISVSSEAFNRAIQNQPAVNALYSLFNNNLYCNNKQNALILRDALWGEILDLFSVLLSKSSKSEGFALINIAMNECGVDNFASSFYLSLTSPLTELRMSSLCFIVNLLGHEIKNPGRFTISDMFEKNISEEVIRQVIEDGWRGFVISEEMTRNFGIRACDALLQTYMISQTNKKNSLKSVIADALGTLLAVCKNAQEFAVDHGLGESIILTLKQVFIRLNMETVESLKRLSDRKRIDPWLTEMETTFRLICNLIVGNEKVKESISNCGLSDIVHKLWSWCNAKHSLLNIVLKMLCTYTNASHFACKSLVLTSSVTGLGLRKNPGSITLIHAVMNQVTREMDLIGKTHDSQSLTLCLQLLSNCCQVTECRSVLAKAQFLQSVSKMNSNFALKKRSHSEEIINPWLDFFIIFTSHQEGQLALTKNEDLLEFIILISSGSKSSLKLKALTVLRNICFHQLNRIRMLSCCPFLNQTLQILSSKETEEINLIATAIWALSYNSQKAKLVFRSGGFESYLLQAKRNCSLANDTKTSELIDIVISVLRNK